MLFCGIYMCISLSFFSFISRRIVMQRLYRLLLFFCCVDHFVPEIDEIWYLVQGVFGTRRNLAFDIGGFNIHQNEDC